MSLKGFHLLFISIATLLFALVALWALVLQMSPTLGMQIFGASCALVAVILPIYGFSFRRKANELSL